MQYYSAVASCTKKKIDSNLDFETKIVNMHVHGPHPIDLLVFKHKLYLKELGQMCLIQTIELWNTSANNNLKDLPMTIL